jgi:hypothetical protein
VVNVQVELVAYLSMIVASVGLVGAVIYYVNDHRNQALMRKTDLIMRLYTTFMSKEFQEAEVQVLVDSETLSGYMKMRLPKVKSKEIQKSSRNALTQ